MKFKNFKRVLAFLLVLCMMVGLVPANAMPVNAEETSTVANATESSTVVDAAIIFSDLHTNSDYKESSTITPLFTTLKNTGLPFSSVTSAGDAFSVNEDSTWDAQDTGYTSRISGSIRNALGNSNIPVNYVWSDHDRFAVQEDDKKPLDKTSHLTYGAGPDNQYGTNDDDNYYIYALSMGDMSTDDRYSAGFGSNRQSNGFTESVSVAIQNFKNDVKNLKKDRPLLIVSHQPLLARRGDNGYAKDWCAAINEVASTMDVAFFFGHNHRHDKAEDYYYAKDSNMPVAQYNGDKSGTPTKINFTHMCAGYLEPSSTNSTSNTTRQGTVIVAKIYEERITYSTYNRNGLYTEGYGKDVTVERDWESVSDGSGDTSGDNTSGDGTSGETPETPQEPVTVNDKESKTTVSAPGITGIRVEKSTDNQNSSLYKAYAKYDIELDGYTQGDEATVSIELDDNFSANGKVIVFDIEKNTSATYNVVNRVVTFKTNHFSVYAVAEVDDSSVKIVEGTLELKKAVRITEVDELVNNQAYVLVSNTGNATLTTNIGSYKSYDNQYYNRFNLSGGTQDGIDLEYLWYYDKASGGFYCKTSNGDQWMNISNKSVSLSSNRTDNSIVSVEESTRVSQTFTISNSSNVYLNKEGGENDGYSTGAHGYTDANQPDTNSNWRIYKVVKTPVTLSVSPESINLDLDSETNEFQLTPVVSVEGKEPSNYIVTYEYNGQIVKVSSEGKVTGMLPGSAEITVKLSKANDTDLTQPISIKIPVTVIGNPEYSIEIVHDSSKEIVDNTLVVKNVETNSTYALDYKVFANGAVLEQQPTSNIAWTTSDSGIATVTDGTVTFHGKEGIVRITVTYEYETGESVTDSVTVSVSKGNYVLPSDGTNDFPDYPNEGSVRYDKTAVAVGNFSETGIAQLELSMTGVPFTTGNTLDVVLMLDRSNSMTDTRLAATRQAVKVFIENIVKNDDGTFNGNRVFVGDFLGGNPEYINPNDPTKYENGRHLFNVTEYTINDQDGFQIFENQEELNALFNKIDTTFQNNGNSHPYGTEYAQSLKYCYELLSNSQNDGHSQACVFMSDGIPNVYQYSATEKITSSSGMVSLFTGTDYNTRSNNYKNEYYSTLMKEKGVTVYSVGLGLKGTNSALGSASATQCENAASILLNDISGPAYEMTNDTGSALSKKDKYFFSVEDQNAAAGMADVFDNISKKILDAAKNVKVTDKIADEYTMIFDIPTGDDVNSDISDKLTNQEFYMEVIDYALTPVVENGVTVDFTRSTATSLMKLYIAEKNGNLYAASDTKGTAFATPTYAEKKTGQKGYYKLESGSYIFVADGTGTHNMVSGAVVTGTNNSNIVISTPYVHYDASTRMLIWTTDRLGNSELALTYFLYLDRSAANVPGTQVDAGTYPTNDYATLEYTNFNGNECQQIFPVPQMTWNGAQVTYVFYLVNKDGQPVNRAGRVIPFSEAVYVTDTFTYAVTWNKNNASGNLTVQYLASEKVPNVYRLFDAEAGYNIYVYEDENGQDKNNHFDIVGTDSKVNTTYVFNTKSDSIKYKNLGTYNKDNVHNGFDFANTTVAFAVLWEPELVEDTVVIDYGLPVDIDVAKNDAVAGAVTGVFGANSGVLEDCKINTGQLVNNLKFATKIVPDGYSGLKYGEAEVISNTSVRYTPTTMEMYEEEKFYYVTTLNFYQEDVLMTSRMYSSVTVIPATTVYYEDKFIDFKVYNSDGTLKYKEETDGNGNQIPEEWRSVGNVIQAVQDTDRPGENKISEAYDADNIYGYDSAYTNSSLYSLGSARAIDVTSKIRGEATFSFYGTGFDIIGLTSNTTGTLIVQVYKGAEATGKAVKTSIVDTYYGYVCEYYKIVYKYVVDEEKNGVWERITEDKVEQLGTNENAPENPNAGDTYTIYETRWGVDENASNALYQVPVIKINNLNYDQYTVKLTAGYNTAFDHTSDSNGDYTLYIDAVRIYDPANDGKASSIIQQAYLADKEAYPEYTELRNRLISATTFNSLEANEVASGAIFIDGAGNITKGRIEDYKSYGPNNEVYLQHGQAVAFDLNATAITGEVASIQLAIKSVGQTGKVEVYGLDASGTRTDCIAKTISTATDLYYDITKLNGMTVVIKNTGISDNAIISLTNIKTTYTAEQISIPEGSTETTGYSLLSMRRSSAEVALVSLCVEDDPVIEDDEIVEDGGIEGDDSVTEDDEIVEDDGTEGDDNIIEDDGTEGDDSVTEDDEIVEDDSTEGDDNITEDDTTTEKNTFINIITTIINIVINTVLNWFR